MHYILFDPHGQSLLHCSRFDVFFLLQNHLSIQYFLSVRAVCDEPADIMSVECSSEQEAIAVIGQTQMELQSAVDMSSTLKELYKKITGRDCG